MANPVWHTQLKIHLDLTRPDLGHPDIPNLWERLYAQDRRFAKQRVPVAQRGLQCDGACRQDGVTAWMHLRQRADGRREAVHEHKEDQARHVAVESDEHKAYKARIIRVAENAGHQAQAEVSAMGRRIITDALVVGVDERRFGFEIQRSPISAGAVRDRVKLAEAAGITPAWHTDKRDLAQRSETHWTRTDDLPWEVIAKLPNLTVWTGVRTLVPERCDRSPLPCPEKRRGCMRTHFTPEPHPIGFDDWVRRIASGDLVAMDFRGAKRVQRFWTPRTDWDQYLDATAGPVTEERQPERDPLPYAGRRAPTCRTVRCSGGCGRTVSVAAATNEGRCWRCAQAELSNGRAAGGCSWCGSTEGVRPYPVGRRCPRHTPAAIAGRPEPGQGAYCPPGTCWCGKCPHASASRSATPTGRR